MDNITPMYGGLTADRARRYRDRTIVYRMSNVAPWQTGQVKDIGYGIWSRDIFQFYVLPK